MYIELLCVLLVRCLILVILGVTAGELLSVSLCCRFVEETK